MAKKAVKKKVVKAKAVVKKVPARKAAKATKTKAVARPTAPAAKAAPAAPAAKAAPAAPPSKKVVPRRTSPPAETLGRPLVTAEEKLYLLFKEDYHARQIFEFLRVDTVGALERFGPQEIIQILSAPVRQTVERVRMRLAENKRHLKDDREFALRHRNAGEPSAKKPADGG